MDLNHSCSVTPNDGHFMPVLGFGTFVSDEGPMSKAGEATKVAIVIGFHHYLHQNEEEISKALRKMMADGTVKYAEMHGKKYQSETYSAYINLVLDIPSKEFSSLHVGGSCILMSFGLSNSHVECHPYLNQRNLMEFRKCKDISVVAYSALGSQRDPNCNENIRVNLCKQHYW
ncbi:hypothetical protein HPG69_014156 [Diceros bicornis minor]|uniref:Uncharacterized protein n=1 Tax=Diceros bicornis minor TaxID=77932 RepID=A0A7J7FJC7_DICBM|nr:hypothetical protein HPG69_014156 [Diceros bicornis minor]